MFSDFCKVSNRGGNGHFAVDVENRYLAYPKCCLFGILTGVYPIFTRFTRNAKNRAFSMLRHKKRYPASWVPFGSFIRIFTRNKHSQKLSEALASTSIISQIRCIGIILYISRYNRGNRRNRQQ